MICPGTNQECDNPGCRHGGCQGRYPEIMAVRDSLPRPDVNVTTTEDGKEHLVISRDGKAKSYEIEGNSAADRVKNVVEKVIGDGHTAEWLP